MARCRACSWPAATAAQRRISPDLLHDAGQTLGASVDVSNIWAQWLRVHRDQLERIHMLTGTKFVQLTADFVRRFAELGDAMLIYTDGAAFDDALRQATRR